jgi:hypothetical protein
MIFTISLTIFGGLNTFGSSNIDNDLEEATGLIEDKKEIPITTSYTDKTTYSLDRGRTRSYLLISGTKDSGSDDDKIYLPNGQLSFSGDYKIQNSFITLDAFGNYETKNKVGTLFISQAGIRSQWNERIQSFVGKERNRRSPGLIVSPSDFIFSNTNLPGQREDRNGVWLARISYQKINGSFDFFLLPIQNETNEGMPDSTHNRAEGAFRGLYQFLNTDVSLMAGRYMDTNHAGVSIQTLLDNKYKLYIELGTQDEIYIYNKAKKNHPIQNLIGFGYEGNEDFSARLEYFENGYGLDTSEFNQMMRMRSLFPSQFAENTRLQSPFIRKKYIITSLSIPEFMKKYNLTFSGIKSLEDDSLLGITRLEYIASDSLLLGFSITQLQGGIGSQYQYRNFNSETTVDLKFSF